MKILNIVFMVSLVTFGSATRLHAQAQATEPSDNTGGPQTEREPARLGTHVPSARPFRFSRLRDSIDYGAPLENSREYISFSYAAQLSGTERLKMALALAEYTDTVPAGKRVEVRAIYDGLYFRRLHAPNPGDSRDVVALGRNQRVYTATVRGTNVQMARDLGYQCTGPDGTWCHPPDEWKKLQETWQNRCSAPGRDPAQLDGACASAGRTPGQEANQIPAATEAGAAEVWQAVADDLLDTIGDEIDDLVRNDNQESGSATREQIYAANMRSYSGTLYLATTFIGFSNPELSRQIDAVGSAALTVHDALHTFRNLAPGASENLAAVALTGNLLGAGLTLTGALMDSGPSPDQIVLEEIGKLRRQVQELREEMHERFDAVHEHLDSVYAAMDEGFRVLREGNRRSFTSILAQLDDGRRQMTEIGRVQLDTQGIVIQQFDLLMQLITDFELAGCDRPLPAVNEGMSETERKRVEEESWKKFRECRDKIATLHGSLLRRQLPLPVATTTMDTWLKERPDKTISWDLANFRRLLSATGPRGATRALAMPESVVGPEAWFGLMDLHDGFLIKYPDLAAQDLPFIITTPFSKSMDLWRSNLVRFFDAVREELRTFQEDSRPSAFSKLFEEAWDRDRFALVLRAVGNPMELLWNCMMPDKQPDCRELELLSSSTYVREKLFAMDEFRRLEQAMSIASTHLQHWVALVFRNDVGRSKSITSLATGWLAIPNLRDVVKRSDVGLESWQRLVDDIDKQMERVKETLRSPDLRAAAGAAFEHELLTGIDFPSLADVPLDEAFSIQEIQ